MNTSGIAEERADDILQQAKWLQEQSLETQVSTQVWDQVKSWLPPGLGSYPSWGL
jgi:hypothetical protein